jgi:hypothetical protein
MEIWHGRGDGRYPQVETDGEAYPSADPCKQDVGQENL